MQTIKQEAIDAISKTPEQVDMDDIMYRPYVIDKIRKGQEAASRGDVLFTDDLKKELDLQKRQMMLDLSLKKR